MGKKVCERTMDFVDEFFQHSYPDWVKSHLEKCDHCQRYVELSRDLRSLSLKKHLMEKDVSWEKIKIAYHPLRRLLVSGASVLVVAALLWGILFTTFSQKAHDVGVSYSDATETIEIEDMDYYTEVALLW